MKNLILILSLFSLTILSQKIAVSQSLGSSFEDTYKFALKNCNKKYGVVKDSTISIFYYSHIGGNFAEYCYIFITEDGGEISDSCLGISIKVPTYKYEDYTKLLQGSYTKQGKYWVPNDRRPEIAMITKYDESTFMLISFNPELL